MNDIVRIEKDEVTACKLEDLRAALNGEADIFAAIRDGESISAVINTLDGSARVILLADCEAYRQFEYIPHKDGYMTIRDGVFAMPDDITGGIAFYLDDKRNVLPLLRWLKFFILEDMYEDTALRFFGDEDND